ncbi:DUF1189 domain-containing protein [Fonticella tunisiensis]|uniref:Uncharacterized protein DUF1189 n=1 Tax=Fonticella tunisiensis TaxID=1096341 RepID=A0A4R7K581_9CLOT|nr:DUF1189 domain-containing protein [Fonticella tunisiensis]TDT46011.1 uncharacterized protein DUF1189 [Fonticella tunisiensis]
MIYEKVGFFTQMIKSMTDIKFYKYFHKQKIEKGFKYLLLLTLLLGSISLIRPLYDYNTEVIKIINSYKKSVPEFELKNGELNVESPNPIIINDDGSPLIIDTSGQIDEKELDKYDSGIFISRYKMVQKQMGNYNTIDFKDIRGFTLSKASVEKWLPFLKWINLFIVVLGFLWFYVSKLFSTLVLSTAALIICGISRLDIKYSSLFKMSFYALTLPSVIKVIVKLSGLYIPFFTLIYYGIGVSYLWMAARAQVTGS